MNTEWKKETVTMDEKLELHEYRITQLEKNFSDMKMKIERIEEICNRLDKKLSLIPDGGLQCNVHLVRMEQYDQRLKSVENVTDKMRKQIITWTAIASCVLFLLSQVAIPYALDHLKVSTVDHKPKTEQVQSSISFQQYPTNVLLGVSPRLNLNSNDPTNPQ